MVAVVTADRHATRLLEVRARLGNLNEDELEAFDFLLEKLETGKVDHGALNLETDPRNWLDEARQEQADRVWYLAFDGVITRRRATVEPRPIEEGLRELRDATTYAPPAAWEGEMP